MLMKRMHCYIRALVGTWPKRIFSPECINVSHKDI